MSEFTESDYTESGYTEGDESSGVTECDLTEVLALLNSQSTKLDIMQSAFLALSDKFDVLSAKYDTTVSSIPMVDDQSLRIYPVNTEVDVIGVDGVGVVQSSFFTPNGDYEYIVQYTVSLDGRMSNFPAHVVTKHVEG